MQLVGVEEEFDIPPDGGEVGLCHVRPVAVHAFEPLHGDPVETLVIAIAIVRERSGVLLVSQHVPAAQAGRDERTMDGSPMLMELSGREALLAPQETRQSDHGTPSPVRGFALAAEQ